MSVDVHVEAKTVQEAAERIEGLFHDVDIKKSLDNGEIYVVLVSDGASVWATIRLNPFTTGSYSLFPMTAYRSWGGEPIGQRGVCFLDPLIPPHKSTPDNVESENAHRVHALRLVVKRARRMAR